MCLLTITEKRRGHGLQVILLEHYLSKPIRIGFWAIGDVSKYAAFWRREASGLTRTEDSRIR